ncbi:MAG: hypothetical protein ACREGR_05075 [Minisyncoccia bacterium]
MADNNSALAPLSEKSGIELHFLETEKGIDNPSVLTRQCSLPGTLRRVSEGLKKGYGYAILRVARLIDRTDDLNEIREVHDASFDATNFLTFTKPGTWEVAVFLIERRDITAGRDTSTGLERDLKAKYLDQRKRAQWRLLWRYDRPIPDFGKKPDDYRHSSFPYDYTFYGEVIEHFVVPVSVQADIFAKKPPKFVWDLGNYFFRDQPIDQCEFRRRFWVMLFLWFIPVGIIPWFLWESMKRILCLLGGLLALSFAVKGWGRAIRSVFSGEARLSLPAAFSGIVEADDSGSMAGAFMGWYGKGSMYRLLATPLAIPFETLALWVLYEVVRTVALFIVAYPLAIATVVGGVIASVLLGFAGVRTFLALRSALADSARKRAETIEPKKLDVEGFFARLIRARREYKAHLPVVLGQDRAARVAHYAPALVCGEAPKEISLAATPAGLVTFKTRLDSFVRNVCRPY